MGTPLEHKVYMEWRMRRRLKGVTALGVSDSHLCCDWLRATDALIMT